MLAMLYSCSLAPLLLIFHYTIPPTLVVLLLKSFHTGVDSYLRVSDEAKNNPNPTLVLWESFVEFRSHRPHIRESVCRVHRGI